MILINSNVSILDEFRFEVKPVGAKYSIFALILFFALLLSAACTDEPADSAGEGFQNQDLEKIEWGREIKLDAIVAMAKSSRIQEIEWHVMPNVIRVLALDGRIFHLKNEGKGVDMRNVLIKEGVPIGKGGIRFRHVF